MPQGDTPTWTKGDLEREMKILYKDIYLALDKTCPRRSRSLRIPEIPWWSKELDNLKRKAEQIEKARRWERRNPHKVPRRSYSQEEATMAYREYNKACKKAKRRSWRDFVSGCDTMLKTASLGRILKRAQNQENAEKENVSISCDNSFECISVT